MICSIDTLREEVMEKLSSNFGTKVKVLSVESHSEEVRGLAVCPGKVIKYVFFSRTKHIRTVELLKLHSNSKSIK